MHAPSTRREHNRAERLMGAAADLAAARAGAGAAMDEAGDAAVAHAAAAAEARNKRADQWEASRERGQQALQAVSKEKADSHREARRREAARRQSQRAELQRSLARVSRPAPETPGTPPLRGEPPPVRGLPVRDYARTFFHQRGSGPRAPQAGGVSVERHERQRGAAAAPARDNPALRTTGARGRRLGKDEREAAARERGHAAMVRVQTGALCQAMERELREMDVEERAAQAAALASRLSSQRLPSRVREGGRQERLRAAFEGQGLLDSDSEGDSDDGEDGGGGGATYLVPAPEEDGPDGPGGPDLQWQEPGASSPRGGGGTWSGPAPEEEGPPGGEEAQGDGHSSAGAQGGAEVQKSLPGATFEMPFLATEAGPRAAPPPIPVPRSPTTARSAGQESRAATADAAATVASVETATEHQGGAQPLPPVGAFSTAASSLLVPGIPSHADAFPFTADVSARSEPPLHSAAEKSGARATDGKRGGLAPSRKAVVIETLENMLTGLEVEGEEVLPRTKAVPGICGAGEPSQPAEKAAAEEARQPGDARVQAAKAAEADSFAFKVQSAENDGKGDGAEEGVAAEASGHEAAGSDVQSEAGRAPPSHGTSRASELDDVESMLLELRNQVSALDQQLQRRKQKSTARRAARQTAIDEEAKSSVKRALNSDFTSSSGVSDLSLLAEEGRAVEEAAGSGSSIAASEAEHSTQKMGTEPSIGGIGNRSDAASPRDGSETNTSSKVSNDLLRNVTVRRRRGALPTDAPPADFSSSSDVSLGLPPAEAEPLRGGEVSQSSSGQTSDPSTLPSPRTSTFPTSSSGDSFLRSLNIPEAVGPASGGEGQDEVPGKESASLSSDISLPSLSTPEVLRTLQPEEPRAEGVLGTIARSDGDGSSNADVPASIPEKPSSVESFSTGLDFLSAEDPAAAAPEDLGFLTKVYSAAGVSDKQVPLSSGPLSEHNKRRELASLGSQPSLSKSSASLRSTEMSEDWSPSFSKGDSLFNVSPSKSESPGISGPRQGLSGASSLASSADSLMLSTFSQGNEGGLSKSLDDLSLYHTPLGTLDAASRDTPRTGDDGESTRLPNRTLVSTMR